MRVSTLDQHPETQFYDLRQMAEQRDYQIVEYTDTISGAKARRPGLDSCPAEPVPPVIRTLRFFCSADTGWAPWIDLCDSIPWFAQSSTC
jgi:hypothetical protein